MDFFIASAWAEEAAKTAARHNPSTFDQIMVILPLIIIAGVFWFLFVGPQRKRTKELKVLLASLHKGEEIVTVGGLLGKVTELGENFILMEISQGVTVKVQRSAVAAIMPKGTYRKL